MVDCLITLYEHNEREFKTNGLGSLNDAASCAVLEERNGEFELTMEYPVMGRHFSDLILRRIIFAKPNPYDNPQPFRIYNISKPINGIVSVSAHHISYDLDGYPLAPFSSSSLLDTFEKINQQMTEPWNNDRPPFHFSTTKSGETDSYDLVAPCSVRALLGGSEGTILDRWPGEYQWDIWEVMYHQHRGADRGVTIEYGKNLTDLEQEENCENCWTALYPYYYTEPQEDEEGNVTGGLVELSDKIIPFPGTYNYSRTYVLDLTGEFEEMPSEEELRARAQKYIEDNELDSPKVSLTVSFLPLSETTSYSKLKILEEVKLCDTVHVYFPRLNVASTSMCIATTYNVLSGKYTEIQLGEAKSDLASTLAGQGNDTEKQIEDALKANNNFLEDSIRKQGQMITGNVGGYVVLHDANGDGKPDELLIMDHENIKDAVNIWRANSAGVGHSSTGYNGDYTTGWTMDGHFNASLITVGELWANIIKAGILSDQKGYNYWNMETGEFRLAATATVDGQTIPSIAEEKANSALKNAKAYSDESIGGFIQDTYNPRIAEMQKQLDGQVETYYYDYEPTLQNEPASLWTNDTEKARHEGDLFYWKAKGYAYRFFKDGDTWKWQLVQDTDITQALAKADAAQDTADHKRRVFVDTPTPPYDVGDLWVQGPQGDIYRCEKSKDVNTKYDFGDWIKASKYTDDSTFTAFLNGEYSTTIDQLKQQDDKKAETWYQNDDPSTAWKDTTTKNNHVGDMWYCSDSEDKTYGLKYWVWDGAKWTEMQTTPPQAVFDRIDGKAQIFVDIPETPYRPGDLWFQSETSDIMTCVKGRDSGSFDSEDWEKRNKYTDDSAFNNFFNGEYKTTIADLQAQDDKKAETWYQSSDPSEDWKDTTTKNNHVGDMWYCTSSSDTTHYGKYWIWTTDNTWSEMKVNPPQAVFDRIDGKAQIFVGASNPTIPYHKGDLWFIDAESDIMTCTNTRTTGSYTASDWKKYNKYTDDSTFNNFFDGEYKTNLANIQGQMDKKAETWYQNDDPSTAWKDTTTKNNHVGDMWYCSDSEDKTYGLKYWVYDNNYTWTEMIVDPPQAVFDSIDGKAQIFVGTSDPEVPYHKGDLWFKDASSDILTCVKTRTSGLYDASEWKKYNKYTDNSELNSFLIGEYKTTIDQLKTQSDKKAETWFQNADPSADWTTLELKNEHVGDLWYCTDSSSIYAGQYLRWNGMTWQEIETIPPKEILNTINGKAQIFTTDYPPEPPYHKNDLWFKDANSPIYISTEDREANQVYSEHDWVKRDNYINAAESKTQTQSWFSDSLTQSALFNKLTSNGTIQGIFMQPNGQLYMNASYIHSGTLTIGGVNNESGTIRILDENGVNSGEIDKYGINFSGGVGIGASFSDSSGTHIAYLQEGALNSALTESSGASHAMSFMAATQNIARNEFVEFSGYETSFFLSSYNGPGLVTSIVVSGSSLDFTTFAIYCRLLARYGVQTMANTINYTPRSISAYNTTLQLSGDIGSGILDESGNCYVSIDDIFSETVDTSVEYYVFLQKEGAGDIWVSEKKPSYFVVSGTPNLRFSWELKAKVVGSEDERMEVLDIINNDIRSGSSFISIFENEQKNIIKNFDQRVNDYEEDYQKIFSGGVL